MPISPERFTLYRVSDTEHVIIDREDRRDPELVVPTTYLKNPKFRLADWYAQRIGELRGLDPVLVRRWRQKVLDTRPLTMETPLATRVEQLLTARGRFPLDPPERPRKNRFECTRDADGSYWVRDRLLVYITKIPVDLLVNERFDVAKWYERRLLRAHDQLCQR
ncbi:hypothetical protein CY34DRAFT_99745, partial [Suillus luteus UH-Slu-Lm8-n1]